MAALRAAPAIWPRRFRRARPAKARPQAESPPRRRHAKARLSTVLSATTTLQSRPDPRRRPQDLWPARPLAGKERKMQLRAAPGPSKQQQTDVHKTIFSPFLA